MSEDKALRDEIAAALLAVQTNGLCKLGRVCEECDCFSDGDGGKLRDETLRREADAVLPVVKTHTQALGMAHIALGNDLTMTRCRAEDAEDLLSSLREAVAHLADQLAQGTDAGFPSKDDAQRFPLSTTVALGRRGGLRDAARLVRSLLPQEGTRQ